MKNEIEEILKLLKKKNLIEAEKKCEKLLEIADKNFEFLNLYAVILFQLKKYDDSILKWQKAIKINPQYHFGYNNLGNVFFIKKDYENALKNYNEAININLNYHEAFHNKGNVYLKLKKISAALESFDSAIKLKNDYIPAIKSKAYLLTKLKRLEESLIEWDKLVEHNPQDPKNYIQRGDVFTDLNRLDEAVKNYSKAIIFQSEDTFLTGNLLHVKSRMCDWANQEDDLKELENKIKQKKKVSPPYPITTFFDSPFLQFEVSKLWSDEYRIDHKLDNNFKNKKSNKIKLAYFSADYRTHAMGHLMVRMLELHDKSKFELHGFYFGPPINKNDLIQKRILNCFDNFVDINLMSDFEVTELTRSLNIDISIDLMGHTGNSNRFGIFLCKSAPIQISFLGYPGTTGSKNIDYLVADQTLIPKNHQNFYSEKIIYLPDTYQPNEETKKISEAPLNKKKLGLPDDKFIFCNFNSHQKITPRIFKIWMDILKKNQNSVLWLLKDNIFSEKNLISALVAENIEPERLIFADHLPLDQHLSRMKFADLFLDTFPYNAHTTCSDAIRVNLPIVTKIGESFASRVSASLLKTINMTDLVTTNDNEYTQLSIDISKNSNLLNKIKKKMEENKRQSNLFKTDTFTKNLEKSYQKVYENYFNGVEPQNIEL